MLCLLGGRASDDTQHEHRDRFYSSASDCMAFTLTSSAFEDGETIPREFTCDGIDVAPPLKWSGPPEGTRSYALIMEDPDAPRGIFTHWLLYDIPATTTTDLREQVDGTALPNSFGRAAYGGPCPPPGHGPHRYVFTLYAIDVPALDVRSRTRASFDRALRAHTLGTARLTGRYERKKTGKAHTT
jgi:Raf kinase inhibitor-like YbhB/YbcL family protein